MAMATENKEHIGFFLFEGEAFDFNSWEGGCIFTGVPKEPSILDDPLCEYLQNKKNIEHKAFITKTNFGFNVQIKNELGLVVEAELNEEKKGRWLPSEIHNTELKGFCFAPNK